MSEAHGAEHAWCAARVLVRGVRGVLSSPHQLLVFVFVSLSVKLTQGMYNPRRKCAGVRWCVVWVQCAWCGPRGVGGLAGWCHGGLRGALRYGATAGKATDRKPRQAIPVLTGARLAPTGRGCCALAPPGL